MATKLSLFQSKAYFFPLSNGDEPQDEMQK